MNETPDVITRYAAAWLAGDVVTLVGCYADHIVAHYGGQSPFAGTHVGRDRFVDVLLESSARSGRKLLSVDQIHDDGETGALFVTESLVVDWIHDGGETVTVFRALRFRVADGKIAECWLFDHDQHLIDRAWSSAAE
jgi:uncharacterized protein